MTRSERRPKPRGPHCSGRAHRPGGILCIVQTPLCPGNNPNLHRTSFAGKDLCFSALSRPAAPRQGEIDRNSRRRKGLFLSEPSCPLSVASLLFATSYDFSRRQFGAWFKKGTVPPQQRLFGFPPGSRKGTVPFLNQAQFGASAGRTVPLSTCLPYSRAQRKWARRWETSQGRALFDTQSGRFRLCRYPAASTHH